MNGISSLALATMNDTRAVEAAAHAWAARGGTVPRPEHIYGAGRHSLGRARAPPGPGHGRRVRRFPPGGRASLAVLGKPDAPRLSRIAAALGLAQNFAALLALVTTGIQQGHMRYHAARMAYRAGARGQEARQLAGLLAAAETADIAGCALDARAASGGRRVSGEAVCRAGPSLALIKYWGKSVKGDNLPATPEPCGDPGGGVFGNTGARRGATTRSRWMASDRTRPGSLPSSTPFAAASGSPCAFARRASIPFPPQRGWPAPPRGSPRLRAPAPGRPDATPPPRTSRASRAWAPRQPPAPCMAASCCFPRAHAARAPFSAPSSGPSCGS